MSKYKILFLYPNEPFLNPPPVGIAILNAVLRGKGYETDIFDTTFYPTTPLSSDKAKEENLQVRPFDFGERRVEPNKGDMFEDLKAKLREYKPHVVALSVLETTFNIGSLLLEVVKQENPEIITVVGGVFPTAAPEIVFANDSVDILCIGEGEEPLLELIEALSLSKEYKDIRNLWVKDNGNVIKRPIRPVINLDELPIPDYSIFDNRRFFRPMAGKVYRTVPVETNRGCPYSCTFCNSPATLKMYHKEAGNMFFRKKSMENIESELLFLTKKWDAEYVYFLSDTFLAMNDDEFNEFTRIYSKIRLPFWMQTRPETLTQERADKLKEVGCHRVSIGLEHGNEEFRKKILKKSYQNKQMIKVSEYLKNAGIPLSINNIIGFPDETRELIFDTIELNRRMHFDTTNAYAFTPFHGTALYDYCIKKGYIEPDTLAGCLTKDTVVKMPQLGRDDIRGLMRTFSLYARMPKEYWDKIRVAERFDDEGNKAFKKLSAIYKERYFS